MELCWVCPVRAGAMEETQLSLKKREKNSLIHPHSPTSLSSLTGACHWLCPGRSHPSEEAGKGNLQGSVPEKHRRAGGRQAVDEGQTGPSLAQ